MKTKTVDMLSGSLMKNLIIFSLPLVLSGILQLLFNATDIIVIGKYAGKESLAAVGSTGALINLLINVFIGVSIGASVVMGRFVGARDTINARDTLHTAMTIAVIGGIIMAFVGYILSPIFLEMMGTPEEVLPLASIYMRIYFLGMPAFMIYNFGASILRAIGDTKRPLYFLIVSGFVNLVLNLTLVIVFDMGVAGVAIGTVVSQIVSAGLILAGFLKTSGFLRLDLQKLRIDKNITKEILKIGLPAGFQGAVFSISNVLIQSSINSFGSVVMAGNTAAGNLEGFVYTGMNAVYQSCLSFTSQNLGAKQYKRIEKILLSSLALVVMVGLCLGVGIYILGHYVLGVYTSDPEVIMYGMERLQIIATLYFLCGIMDVFVGTLRGVGYSVTPMIVSLTGVCMFRVIWIYTIFRAYPTRLILYISYPISWVLTLSLHLITYLIIRKKVILRED